MVTTTVEVKTTTTTTTTTTQSPPSPPEARHPNDIWATKNQYGPAPWSGMNANTIEGEECGLTVGQVADVIRESDYHVVRLCREQDIFTVHCGPTTVDEIEILTFEDGSLKILSQGHVDTVRYLPWKDGKRGYYTSVSEYISNLPCHP